MLEKSYEVVLYKCANGGGIKCSVKCVPFNNKQCNVPQAEFFIPKKKKTQRLIRGLSVLFSPFQFFSFFSCLVKFLIKVRRLSIRMKFHLEGQRTFDLTKED